MLAEALGVVGPRREVLQRRLGPALHVGVEMLYMSSRQAHHRGQACMLAHQIGFPLPIEGDVRDLELGKVVERVGSGDPGAILGNRSGHMPPSCDSRNETRAQLQYSL